MEYVNMPGPGGSLGQCVICGEDFLAEILLGQTVPLVMVNGDDKWYPVHRRKCKAIAIEVNGKSPAEALKELPDGPLKKACERVVAKEN